MAAIVPYMLRRQVLGRSVMRSELPRYQAMASAIKAPMRKRAAAISDQGRSRAPRRVHTFIPAKNTCARTIHARPSRERREGRESREGREGRGMEVILAINYYHPAPCS